MTSHDADKPALRRLPDSRPLYVQVREILRERISAGVWRPGDLIPNEFAIARELGVSQGTIRKALDALTADHLLVRRQGRGTYVAESTPASMLFRFFNFVNADGQPIEPQSHDTKLSEGRPTREERKRLALEPNARVWRISRVRTADDQPLMLETIILPASLFSGLKAEPRIPNTLYDYFQKAHGVTVARGDERITAACAGAKEAGALAVSEGTPLLKVDRLMYSLQDRPVEWRISLCRTDHAAYQVKLR